MNTRCAIISACLGIILMAPMTWGASDSWVSLFNGKNLDGWKANENPGTFRVVDGMIVAQGQRSHLFYTGPVEAANFQDFELKVDVKTAPRANSGRLLPHCVPAGGLAGEGV